MKNSQYLVLGLILFVLALYAGCTQNTQAPAVPATTMTQAAPALPGDTVKTMSSSLGTILTDANGRTLYLFASDIPGNGKSTCYGGCADLWPAFSADSLTVSPPLAAADFSTLSRDNGVKQTTYKGWPLYYFSKDTNPGDTNGENVQGVWSVAKPDYTILYSRQPGAGTFLTDGAGRTLYFFALENPGEAACTGTCLSNWPVFSSGPLVAPSFLKATDFTVTRRPDGSQQSLYKGRLLYYFAKDTKPGDMNGQGVNNAWFVANISGYVPPAPTPVPTTLPTPVPTFDYGGSGNSGSSGY